MPSSVTIVQSAAHGTEKVKKDGTVTYTPAARFTGTDKFKYQVCNADDLCGTAVVSLTVKRPGSVNPVDGTDPDGSSSATSAPVVRLGELAFTGAQVLGALALGLVLLVGGGLVTTTTRRRDDSS
jgi:hypothetical protein